MKISFLKNILLLIILSCKVTDGFEAAESMFPDVLSKDSQLSTVKHFVRERVSGLYYSASVAGYGSSEGPLVIFLKQKFSDGWTFKESKLSKDRLPRRGEAGYGIYEHIKKYVAQASR